MNATATEDAKPDTRPSLTSEIERAQNAVSRIWVLANSLRERIVTGEGDCGTDNPTDKEAPAPGLVGGVADLNQSLEEVEAILTAVGENV